jgi:hypothetical protein
MKVKTIKKQITPKELETLAREFIADWLNEGHENYPVYVKGMKLFLEFLKGKSINLDI